MSRFLLALDRVATLLLGVVLVCGGLAALVWSAHWPQRWSDHFPDQLSTTAITDAAATSWWPWAVGVGGVIVGLSALGWLVAHIPTVRRGKDSLPGSNHTGQLAIDIQNVVAVGADELASEPAIHSSRARVRRDRGRVTIDVTAVCEPPTDLAAAADAASRVGAQIRHTLDTATPPIRLHLHTRHRRRRTRRLQ